MLVQIHILQNYAPSNLNRDDTGSPKDAIFGGVRRGRISSQCLKRSMRRSPAFEEAFRARNLLATRTKRLPLLLSDELAKLGASVEEVQAIVARLPEIGRESGRATAAKATEGEVETAQLIFIAPNEIRPMAESLLQQCREAGKAWSSKKIDAITKELGPSVPRSVDVAMFGRMTTSAAFEDVQAAVQVAHAISTNTLVQEFDYFTAIDDLKVEPGAGMIEDVEFNSSTYYRYINLHWEGLLNNLGGDIPVSREAVVALVEAAAKAQPSGKQNTFAAQNPPDMILVEVRSENLPVSYANAFLSPVRPGPNGHPSTMECSIAVLFDYQDRLSRMYGLTGDTRAVVCSLDVQLGDATRLDSLQDLGSWLAAQLPQ